MSLETLSHINDKNIQVFDIGRRRKVMLKKTVPDFNPGVRKGEVVEIRSASEILVRFVGLLDGTGCGIYKFEDLEVEFGVGCKVKLRDNYEYGLNTPEFGEVCSLDKELANFRVIRFEGWDRGHNGDLEMLTDSELTKQYSHSPEWNNKYILPVSRLEEI